MAKNVFYIATSQKDGHNVYSTSLKEEAHSALASVRCLEIYTLHNSVPGKSPYIMFDIWREDCATTQDAVDKTLQELRPVMELYGLQPAYLDRIKYFASC